MVSVNKEVVYRRKLKTIDQNTVTIKRVIAASAEETQSDTSGREQESPVYRTCLECMYVHEKKLCYTNQC